MANISGHTKKVTMNAIYFLSYCLGNILGPQVFRENDAPNYTRGYTALLICLIISSVSIALYGVLCKLENRRRDNLHGTVDAAFVADSNPALALSDKTDKEKVEFRYTY